MRLLLDSSVFLWLNIKPGRIARPLYDILGDPETERFVSLASCWELAIKQSTGKLALPAPASEYFPARLDLLAASLLPITAEHVYTAAALPYHHRDPFDRLLIAQSMVEQLPVVTADARFAAYGIELLPA